MTRTTMQDPLALVRAHRHRADFLLDYLLALCVTRLMEPLGAKARAPVIQRAAYNVHLSCKRN